MPSLPSRKSLETLKRVELQKLCKDYGVKANLKSEALIDLLLDAQKPATRTTRRSVSSRMYSRPGSSRISSVIIHGTDDDDQVRESSEEHSLGHGSSMQKTTESKSTTPPATRARKAKEQTKLGVGRPVAAGGSGPRAVTKSLSVSKGRSAKTGKTLKPTEDTIPEEEPEREASTEPMQDVEISSSNDVPINETQAQLDQPHGSGEEPLASLATIDKHVADALRPLYEQMKSLKSEVELMQSLRTELRELKTQVAEMGTLKAKVKALTGELRDLRMQATSTTHLAREQELSQAGALEPLGPSASSMPSSHPSGKEPGDNSILNSTEPDSVEQTCDVATSRSVAMPSHPGAAPVMLGKRRRDSPGSTTAGIMEEGPEDEFPENDSQRKTTRPARKRAKMSDTPDEITAERMSMVSSGHSEDQGEGEIPTPGLPKFTVFRGPSEFLDHYVDAPPPNNPLPDLFPPSSAGAGPSYMRQGPSYLRQGPTGTSSAHASENQQPFNFSFPPMSSTPAHGLFMPSFPYPEPPQSPSPAGINPSDFLRGERADVFQSFGLHNHRRPPRSRLGSNVGGGFVDPAALTRRTSDRDSEGASGNNAGSDLVMEPPEPGPSSSGGVEAVADVSMMKRTMYGTELDGDTRFGDFGVEGVSNGAFWVGGRY